MSERRSTKIERHGARQVVALIGHPIHHSLSPAMHNAAFDKAKLNFVYVPLDVHPKRLKQAMAGVRALGIAGLNVTVPHKETILPFLDDLSKEARLIGAVNTVQRKGDRLIGHNTDGRGFLRAIQSAWGVGLASKRIVILGAGGAARAVAVQAVLEGAAAVTIGNRSASRGRRLLRHLRAIAGRTAIQMVPLPGSALASAIRDSDLIVQATTVGLIARERSLIEAKLFRSHHRVCDLIYRPTETAFLREAQSAGAATLNGIGMLLHQGALAFEIWTGSPAPLQTMETVLIQQVTS